MYNLNASLLTQNGTYGLILEVLHLVRRFQWLCRISPKSARQGALVNNLKPIEEAFLVLLKGLVGHVVLIGDQRKLDSKAKGYKNHAKILEVLHLVVRHPCWFFVSFQFLLIFYP